MELPPHGSSIKGLGSFEGDFFPAKKVLLGLLHNPNLTFFSQKKSTSKEQPLHEATRRSELVGSMELVLKKLKKNFAHTYDRQFSLLLYIR